MVSTVCAFIANAIDASAEKNYNTLLLKKDTGIIKKIQHAVLFPLYQLASLFHKITCVQIPLPLSIITKGIFAPCSAVLFTVGKTIETVLHILKMPFSKKSDQDMYSTVFEAKQHEHILIHNAIVEASKIAKQLIDDLNHVVPFIDSEYIRDIKTNKIERMLERIFYTTDTKISAKECAKDIVNNAKKLHELQLTDSQKKQVEDVLSTSSEFLEKSYATMQKLCKKLDSLVHSIVNPSTIHHHNRLVLSLIRNIISCPAYQMLKEHEDIPLVRYLHAIVLGMYTQPKLVDVFEKIGALLSDQNAKNITDVAQKTFSQMVEEVRARGKKGKLITVIGVKYIVRFTKNFIASCLCITFAQKIGLKYDGRLQSENNIGAFYNEKFSNNIYEIDSYGIYTGSPTVGNNVSPEFRAALQALENRYFMSTVQLKKYPYPFVSWSYTNLQNITASDENGRSVAIMKLNEEYPFSFYGATITQDSKFYTDGLYGHSIEKIKKHIQQSELATAELSEQYLEMMVSELKESHNFSLENRIQHKGGGYYFYVRSKDEQEKLSKEFRTISYLAYNTIKSCKRPDDVSVEEWNWMQKAAFRELVHMGIMRYFDAKIAARNLNHNGGGLLHSKICKEGIDRGGKTMAAFYWGLSYGHKENSEAIANSLTLAAIESRPLLTRYRMILKHRIYPFQALTIVLPRKELHAFLDTIVDIESNGAVVLRENRN